MLLKDVITYFKLSVDNMAFKFSGKLDNWTPASAQQASERMYAALSQRDLKAELTMRVGDLKLMVDGIQVCKTNGRYLPCVFMAGLCARSMAVSAHMYIHMSIRMGWDLWGWAA